MANQLASPKRSTWQSKRCSNVEAVDLRKNHVTRPLSFRTMLHSQSAAKTAQNRHYFVSLVDEVLIRRTTRTKRAAKPPRPAPIECPPGSPTLLQNGARNMPPRTAPVKAGRMKYTKRERRGSCDGESPEDAGCVFGRAYGFGSAISTFAVRSLTRVSRTTCRELRSVIENGRVSNLPITNNIDRQSFWWAKRDVPWEPLSSRTLLSSQHCCRPIYATITLMR